MIRAGRRQPIDGWPGIAVHSFAVEEHSGMSIVLQISDWVMGLVCPGASLGSNPTTSRSGQE